MSKIINNIEQIEEGGLNPRSNIREEKLWKLHFEDDSEPRILGRTKMLEYLSKGTLPPKTVDNFKKWEITTTSGSNVRIWSVTYDDKLNVVLINKDFYSLLTSGHKNKDEEKSSEISGERGAVSDAITKAAYTDKKEVSSLTTLEEKEELKELRKKAIDQLLHDAVKDNYGSHPNATGYEDSK